MQAILAYVERNWGAAQGCAHCENAPVSICGGCMEYVYCGSNCQAQHWNAHRLQCVNGRAGEKRTREEEEEREPSGLQEVKLSDLSGDIWLHISKFLSTEDLKNVNATQRAVQSKLRRMFFSKFRFVVDEKDPHFDDIKHSIQAVRINTYAGLKAIAFKRDNNIKDVKVGPEFFVPNNAKLNWPAQITHLDFSETELYVGDMDRTPPGLKVLILNWKFAGSLDHLPQTLEVLDMMTSKWNQSIENIPMTNLKKLYLGPEFNQPFQNLKNATKLQKLFFGMNFNQPIDNIPTSIEVLEFDKGYGEFNQSVDHLSNCTRLRKLELSHMFNQPIDNLPESLIELETGPALSHPFPALPNLKKLDIRSAFTNYENIPRNVEYLDFQWGYLTTPLANLPSTVQILRLPFYMNAQTRGNIFPAALREIHIPQQLYRMEQEVPPGVKIIKY